MDAGRLDRRVTLLARQAVQEVRFGTQVVTWVAVQTVWAQVTPMLPSRAERIAEGIEIARQPIRVRMRWRNDVTTAMALEFEGRRYRIVGGPAELGRREGIEIMAELLTTEGDEL